MTARLEREFAVSAHPEAVWGFVADPNNRARVISVVDNFETSGETVIWHVTLPVPGLSKTISVRTRTVEQTPPTFVRFEGQSSFFDVSGEHRIEESDIGTRIVNTFSVDGHIPGVETFFRRNLDGEIANLENALLTHLGER